jgi:hypothetical protein
MRVAIAQCEKIVAIAAQLEERGFCGRVFQQPVKKQY